MSIARSLFERLMEAIVIALMAILAVVVTLGIVYRTAGAALVWYDEVASILLAWLTFFGAALGALKRAHISVPEVMRLLAPRWRAAAFVLAEALVFAFFIIAGWIGYHVMVVIEGSTLVSLPEVPQALAQSVIPIGAALYVIAEALSLPAAWRKTMADSRHAPTADATASH